MLAILLSSSNNYNQGVVYMSRYQKEHNCWHLILDWCGSKSNKYMRLIKHAVYDDVASAKFIYNNLWSKLRMGRYWKNGQLQKGQFTKKSTFERHQKVGHFMHGLTFWQVQLLASCLYGSCPFLLVSNGAPKVLKLNLNWHNHLRQNCLRFWEANTLNQ